MNEPTRSLRNTLSSIGFALLLYFLSNLLFQKWLGTKFESVSELTAIFYSVVFSVLSLGIFVIFLRPIPSSSFQAETRMTFSLFLKLLAMCCVSLLILSVRQALTGTVSSEMLNTGLMRLPVSPISLLVLLVVVPFIHEFIYRKLLAEKLLAYGQVFYMITSGVLFSFAFAPFAGLGEAPYYLLLGIALAYATLFTGNWLWAVCLHALANLLTFILPILLAPFGVIPLRAYSTFMVVLALLGLYLLIREFKSHNFLPGPRELDGISKFQAFVNAPGIFLYLLVKVVIALFVK